MDQVDTRLIPNSNWQTKSRGSNSSEYEIYAQFAKDLGWKVKSYEEWLNS